MLLSTAVALAGCKAAPAPGVGFADPSRLKEDPNSPYDKYWSKPGLDLKSYDKIYVAEVDTSYMLQTTTWQKGERQGAIGQDVRTVAEYSRDAIKKAFRDDPTHHFQVLESPSHDPHTLVCETALTELVPSKVLLNALGYAPFWVGTGITVVRTVANDKSSVAFEARVRDAASGEIVILAADRETEQYAPVDLRGLTWYSDAEGIIDDWCKQFVNVTNARPGEKVEGSRTFRLLPW